MIQVDKLQIQKCTAGYYTHTQRWGGGLLIICRFEEMSFKACLKETVDTE